jgi:hypothetical protein
MLDIKQNVLGYTQYTSITVHRYSLNACEPSYTIIAYFGADMDLRKNKFTRDMDRLLEKLDPTTEPSIMEQLRILCEKLVDLNQRKLVKINHSIMEVICARYLLEQGYEVDVEHLLKGGPLSADIFATRTHLKANGDSSQTKKEPANDRTTQMGETLLVEVETGYVPPDAALNPGLYRQARIATKISRYSGHARKFALATPNYHVVQVPNVLLSPPDMRSDDALQELKILCDSFYYSPPITLKDLARVELDAIYIINVDFEEVIPTPPRQYLDTVLRARGWLGS